MQPLDYTMGQLAVQRMRRELEAEGEMCPDGLLGPSTRRAASRGSSPSAAQQQAARSLSRSAAIDPILDAANLELSDEDVDEIEGRRWWGNERARHR
jgi:hypothetical protein